MVNSSQLLEPFPDTEGLVESIGPAVVPGDLDKYLKFKDFQVKSYHHRILIETWKGQQDQDRETRKYYARWLLIVVCIQIAIINIFFLLIGLDIFKLEPLTANTFIISVFVEISAMVLIVVNYLFPKTKDTAASLVDLFKRNLDK